jgi:transcriptional regulator with XRE-family HTH domain
MLTTSYPLPPPKRYTLKTARRLARVSITALVERSGVSRATVCRVQRGDRFDTKHGTVRAIEAALGLAPGQLLIRRQDDSVGRCFACDRAIYKNSFGRLQSYDAITIDGQRVIVGRNCAGLIAQAGKKGFQPPPGGPRLWIDLYAPAAALKAAGITITRGK